MDPMTMAAIAQMMGQAMQSKTGGLASFLGELFNDRRTPYANAQRDYDRFLNQGVDKLNPFYNAGTEAIPDYKNWINSMKDPSGFINNLMGNYKESPFARFQKEEGQNAINNAASASGMIGSTPYLRESANYAENVASKDMQDWLSRVLGINNEYGGGLGNLYGGGIGAAKTMADMFGKAAGDQAELAYAKERAANERGGGLFGGALKFLL